MPCCPSLGPDHLIVDCSTIDPDVERVQHERVAATGASYLEAPLSGGTIGAEKGTLTLMVGGDAATLDRARPAFEPIAALVVHVGGPGMGQVVKLCNNLIYAAQMVATAEASALAARAGADPAKLHEVLVHATADCVAVRTRFPFAGVVPDSPASNGWKPGFMTDLMAKDLDLALAYGAQSGVPMAVTATSREALAASAAAGYGREDFSAVAKVVASLAGLGRASTHPTVRAEPEPMTVVSGGAWPALILAADHRARGVVTIERYADYLGAIAAALPHSDGILASSPAVPRPRRIRRGHVHAPDLPVDQPHRPGRSALGARRSPRHHRGPGRGRRLQRREDHDPHRPRRSRSPPAPSSCSAACSTRRGHAASRPWSNR